MATRQQFAIAHNLTNFTNTMQEGLNANGYILQRINPQTGERFLNIDERGNRTEFTLEEIKDYVSRNIGSFVAYKTAIEEFVDKVGREEVDEALSVIYDIDLENLLLDVGSYWEVARWVYQRIPSATTDAHLIELGNYIIQRIPDLKIIRRRWNLG